MTCILGVDGGASGTTASIVDEMGCVRGVGHAGSANPLAISLDRSVGNVSSAVGEALVLAGATLNDVRAAAFCLSGVGDEGDTVRVQLGESIAAKIPLSCPVHIDHDAIAAHVGAFLGSTGVIVIAGTGAIGFAVDSQGVRYRADGWGGWIGDEGSRFWIGMEGLKASFRAHDGRGEPTSFFQCCSLH